MVHVTNHSAPRSDIAAVVAADWPNSSPTRNVNNDASGSAVRSSNDQKANSIDLCYRSITDFRQGLVTKNRNTVCTQFEVRLTPS